MTNDKWTAQDNMELKSLSNKLFVGDTFKMFTEQEEATPEYKRYSELVERKQKALSQFGNRFRKA